MAQYERQAARKAPLRQRVHTSKLKATPRSAPLVTLAAHSLPSLVVVVSPTIVPVCVSARHAELRASFEAGRRHTAARLLVEGRAVVGSSRRRLARDGGMVAHTHVVERAAQLRVAPPKNAIATVALERRHHGRANRIPYPRTRERPRGGKKKNHCCTAVQPLYRSVHLRYTFGTPSVQRYSASHQARYSAVQSVQRTFPVHFDFSRSALIFAVSCKVALPVRVKIRGALRPANAPVIEDPLFIWAWFWRASACAARRFSVASRQKQPPPSAPFDPP